MTILSDRWIKKIALEKEMIKPFVSRASRLNKNKFPMDFRLLDMMLEYLTNLKSSQM